MFAAWNSSKMSSARRMLHVTARRSPALVRSASAFAWAGNVHNESEGLMDRASISRRALVRVSVASVVAAGIGSPAIRAGAQATPAGGGPVPLADALATLSPEPVFENFYQLSRIPRPSHHEAAFSAFLAGFGRDLGLETGVNEVGGHHSQTSHTGNGRAQGRGFAGAYGYGASKEP